jgi:glutathione peroxidase
MKSIDGKDIKLSSYKGKKILIVNVASKCGYTPQYDGLEKLYKKFKDQGLVILGFPCNQFGGQEPGSNEEIQQFCQLNFGVTFPVMAKIDVNGSQAEPLFQFLKQQAPGVLGTEMIKWNFTKFLVNKQGQVIKRFAPTTEPAEIESEIQKLLTY